MSAVTGSALAARSLVNNRSRRLPTFWSGENSGNSVISAHPTSGHTHTFQALSLLVLFPFVRSVAKHFYTPSLIVSCQVVPFFEVFCTALLTSYVSVASFLLDELTGEGEYARLLGKFLKLLLRFKK